MRREIVQKLKLAFWNGHDMPTACAYAGITPEAYAEAVAKDGALSSQMLAAQGYAACLARNTWANAIRKGNAKAAMAYLERREPERYDLRYIRKFGRASDDS